MQLCGADRQGNAGMFQQQEGRQTTSLRVCRSPVINKCTDQPHSCPRSTDIAAGLQPGQSSRLG